MSTTHAHVLQKRHFRLDEHEGLRACGVWFEGRPLATQLLNAYTLLIPAGERFIIRSCRHVMHKADAALTDELRAFFYQEGTHAREHDRMRKAMTEQGVGLGPFRRFLEWVSYEVLEPLTPPVLRLATAAAIEHHNAVIASYFIGQDLLRGIRPGETRRLLLWHFAEEIEHKETVFKLLLRVSGSRALRIAGLVISAATFLTFLALLTLVLGFRTRAVRDSGWWREIVKEWRDSSGLVAMLLRESKRYLEPAFHPRLEESRVLLDAALAELEQLGVERPLRRVVLHGRGLPTAFRDRVSPSLERARVMLPRNPYFGECIESYDGAWVRTGGQRKLNFCTYSYLGLLGHPRIQEAAASALERYGTGTHGVRLLGGNLDLHESLEARIAAFFKREAAITFSSGFVTNLAVIAALVWKEDFVFSDSRNHASIVDGCRLSGADVTRFTHNDMEDLSARLRCLPEQARKLIVVDGVFSMDGDVVPLETLIALRDEVPNTLLMVDEAHSLGVLGRHGRGIEEHFGCVGQIDVLMGTLSKAIPAQGGYIVGSQDLVTFLRYNARGFVFSAALAPTAAAAAQAALDVIEEEGETRQGRLMSNVRHFVGRLRHAGFQVGDTASAIIPILLGSEDLAFDMAARCNAEGLYAMPVIHPAVARGTERLRMNVTCDHRLEDLDYGVTVLCRARAAIRFVTPDAFASDPS